MSRILPLEKDVNLDKRYINESETITEPALAAVINGGGGGGNVIVTCSITEWPVNKQTGALRFTGDELICSTLGITTDDLENILTGNVLAIKAVNRLFPIAPMMLPLKGSSPEHPESAFASYGLVSPTANSCYIEFGSDDLDEHYVHLSTLGNKIPGR